jgi:DNA-binding transcriptional regulator YhcF (GntR family)
MRVYTCVKDCRFVDGEIQSWIAYLDGTRRQSKSCNLDRQPSGREAMTLSDDIFQALATAIVSGKIKPGQRVDEPSVCRKFGVSRTPVREALRRLSGTGLVEVTPRKGVTAAQINVDQLTDMYEHCEFEVFVRD